MKNRANKYITLVASLLLCAGVFLTRSVPVWADMDYDGNGFVTQDKKTRYLQEVWGVTYDPNNPQQAAEDYKKAVSEYASQVGVNNSGDSNNTSESSKKEEYVHSYTATVTKEPTCTETGTETKVCKNCGDTIESVIPALGHKAGEWVTEKEPTCFEEGRNVHYCTVCGETVETMIVDKLPHTEGEWEIAQKPTLTKTGLKVVKCTECSEVLKEETIPANTTLLKIIIGISGGAAIIVLIVGIVEDTILLYIIIRLSAAWIIIFVLQIIYGCDIL